MTLLFKGEKLPGVEFGLVVKLPIGTLEFHTSVSILGHGFTPNFNFLLTGILGDSRRHPQWLAPAPCVRNLK